ncbi:MAG TPA: heme-binding domain-containing protein [Candidatus Binataceae bacterium]|nr:heme-binding domain-containing protein [Candidatus Binataceae bacterium]
MVTALFAAQLVPLTRGSNAPSIDTLPAPARIEATLKRACYDCHSNQTRWPWYSRVAPLSWLIVHEVNAGRRQLNFSDWESYYPATRRRKLEWIGRAVRADKMPPWDYTLIHRGARLSEADKAALEEWIESALAIPAAERSK